MYIKIKVNKMELNVFSHKNYSCSLLLYKMIEKSTQFEVVCPQYTVASLYQFLWSQLLYIKTTRVVGSQPPWDCKNRKSFIELIVSITIIGGPTPPPCVVIFRKSSQIEKFSISNQTYRKAPLPISFSQIRYHFHKI